MIEVINFDSANVEHVTLAALMRHDLYCVSGEYEKFAVKYGSASAYGNLLANFSSKNPRYVFFLKEAGQFIAHAVIEGEKQPRPTEAYIDIIYVAPYARRKGYGIRLLKECLAIAVAAGFQKAWLGTLASRPQNMAFYKSQGWVSAGAHPEKPHLNIWEKKLA